MVDKEKNNFGRKLSYKLASPGWMIFIFLIGELLDRILFYIDFDPMNINNMINEQLNIVRDEKKRG